jgi:tRNA (guanine9-N1)-methyltransferase
MEAEERPTKLRKLSHATVDQQASINESLLDASPSKPTEDEEQRQKNEPISPANGTDTDRSRQKHSSESEPAQFIPTHADPLPASDPKNASGLSKKQIKRLLKKQQWEAGREERKMIRKEKKHEKRARERAAQNGHGHEQGAPPEACGSMNAENVENGQNNGSHTSVRPPRPRQVPGTLLPITLIIDCAFDDLMHDKERISLASQITRCYSDNHRAPFKSHLVISSFSGQLKTRFDTTLSQHYKNWKGVTVLDEDYVEAAERAKERMTNGRLGGQLTGAFALHPHSTPLTPAELEKEAEVVYLTSDSEHTLDRLKPYSTYIIGGLVDKNRHKGICYKRACDRGIKTAKLPIAEYMEMQSRFVLATNHVVEIMVRWLECGDWGEAFLKVVPKRKGGRLRSTEGRGDGGEIDLEANGEVDVEVEGGEDYPTQDGDEVILEDAGGSGNGHGHDQQPGRGHSEEESENIETDAPLIRIPAG